MNHETFVQSPKATGDKDSVIDETTGQLPIRSSDYVTRSKQAQAPGWPLR